MGGADRAGGKAKPLKVSFNIHHPQASSALHERHILTCYAQQPKKEKKEDDEVDAAHKAKMAADAKARKEMAEKAKGGKGPLNTGQQGIKKSGKK
jgi:hypothetical protein